MEGCEVDMKSTKNLCSVPQDVLNNCQTSCVLRGGDAGFKTLKPSTETPKK